MTVESVTYISDLDVNSPAGGDSISQGDDHIRNTLSRLKNTFPNVSEPVTATAESLTRSPILPQRVTAFLPHTRKRCTLQLMYAHNVSSVTQIGTGGYRVNFKKPTDGFDHHYAVQATAIATNQRPVTIQVTWQDTDNYVEFTV